MSEGSKRRLKLWIRMLAVTRSSESGLREFLRLTHDTTLPRFDVLAALYRRRDGVTMSELSRMLLVSNGNATAVVDRLEKDGLVRRTQSDQDRRTVFVGLTPEGLAQMVAGLDPATRARIDLQNPVRVQRAWEVLTATGRGIVDWQAETPPPLIAPAQAHLLVLQSDRDWLAARIARRFHMMMDQGALEEVRAMLPDWDPAALWAKAIGAPEIIAYLKGHIPFDEAIAQAIVATRQYAKAQRSFFRGRMRDWNWIEAAN